MQIQGAKREMSDGLVALAARRDKNRIAADDGLLRRFSGMRVEGPLPQDRLRILQVTPNEQLDFFLGRSQVDDRHLTTQAMQGVIASRNNAAGGVSTSSRFRSLSRPREFRRERQFFRKVPRFAFEIGRTVRPTHPGGHTVDSGMPTRFEDRRETRFDLIVATDGGASKGGEIFRPMGFPGTGHADQSEA